MKFCPVVPPALCAKLPTPAHGLFCFATACITNPGYAAWYYAEKYPGLGAVSKIPLVIDCPIYESGEFLEPYDMRQVELHMKPDFMVVPDIRHDLQKTLRNFDRYVPILGDSAMGVLQGNSWHELEECAVYMAKSVRKFAIPKDVSRLDISRYELLVQLFATGIFSDKAEIHLFGGDWPYSDEARCGQMFAQVKSFDSAEPFNTTLAGYSVAISKPPARRKDWMNLGPENLGAGFARLFERNIEVVESLAKCN